MDLAEAVGRNKKIAQAQRALRDQADLFAEQYKRGADRRLRKDEARALEGKMGF
jgi:hypothetical protein